MMVLDRFITRIDQRTGFDRWGPRANPLIRQTLRRKTRVSLWIAFGIGVVGLVISTWQILNATFDDLTSLDAIVLVVGWPFLAFTPFATSFSAVLHTRRAIVPERFELIHLTTLTNEAIVWALIFDALYALRYALIAVVGLMPVLVIKTFHMLLVFDFWFKEQSSYYTYDEITPPTTEGLVIPTLFALGLIVAAWGLTLLGAAFGVRSAMFRRRTEVAVSAAPFALLLLVSGQWLCLGVIAYISYDLAEYVLPEPAASIIILLVMMGAPYVMMITTMRATADRWQRELASRI